MYVDFKVTMWERINIPEEIEEDFLEEVRSGRLETANDAFDIFSKKVDDCFELLEDTSERLTVKENDGFSTLELWEEGEDGYILYSNGKS